MPRFGLFGDVKIDASWEANYAESEGSTVTIFKTTGTKESINNDIIAVVNLKPGQRIEIYDEEND